MPIGEELEDFSCGNRYLGRIASSWTNNSSEDVER